MHFYTLIRLKKSSFLLIYKPMWKSICKPINRKKRRNNILDQQVFVNNLIGKAVDNELPYMFGR